jgi:ABC-type ATPase with predicted acetyltransferase domain
MTTKINWPNTVETHALWSSDLERWYFWCVLPHGETLYQSGSKEIYSWEKHKNQEASTAKLKRLINRGLVVEKANPSNLSNTDEYTPMNLNNAALLVRDDITTVLSEQGTHFVLHNSILEVKLGDELLIKNKSGTGSAIVARIDSEPQIDVNSNQQYGWVLANITAITANIKQEIAKTDLIAQALKKRQSVNVREQILQQFGVADAAELLAIGSTPPCKN